MNYLERKKDEKRGGNITFASLHLDRIMAKKKKPVSLKIAQKLQRKLSMQQGFYDGRFKERKVKDKKKEQNRRRARGKVKLKEEDT